METWNGGGGWATLGQRIAAGDELNDQLDAQYRIIKKTVSPTRASVEEMK
jgi:hypothetical protein